MAEQATRYTRLVFGCSAGTRMTQDLAEAAEIADWLGLELAAMMIEDETIATLGAHPGATLLTRSGTRQSGMGQLNASAGSMEHETRVAIETFRRQLETQATRIKLRWSFESLRGSVETVIANTVRHSDIVIYCEPESSLEREAYPERNLWQAVEKSPGATLYRPSRPLTGRSGVMTINQPADQPGALDAVAQQLSHAMRERLRNVEGNGDWQALATEWGFTAPRLIVLARGTMGLSDSDAIAQAARTLRVPLLVLENVPEKT